MALPVHRHIADLTLLADAPDPRPKQKVCGKTHYPTKAHNLVAFQYPGEHQGPDPPGDKPQPTRSSQEALAASKKSPTALNCQLQNDTATKSQQAQNQYKIVKAKIIQNALGNAIASEGHKGMFRMVSAHVHLWLFVDWQIYAMGMADSDF